MTCIASSEHLSCTRCSLHNYRQNVVPGHGNLEATIALVGEAPGLTEDKEGKPFVGAAGKLMDTLLGLAEINPHSVWKTNIVHCHPPENNIREYPDAITRCPDLWLRPELDSLPRLRCIIALGRTAGTLWFPGAKATELSKLARTLPNGKQVIGSFHPSYVLRGGGEWVKDSIIGSLQRANLYSIIETGEGGLS